MTEEEFKKVLTEKFDLNKDTFRCYTVESYPTIKVILFKKNDLGRCYIGFLINGNFHVLGQGSFSCMDKDAKLLYIVLTGSLPDNEIILKDRNYYYNDDERESIIEKLNQIFS